MIRKNNWKCIVGLLLIPIFYNLILNTNHIFTKGFSKAVSGSEKKIILIDPGHGGLDGGAVSKRGTVEKDINLKIALKLKSELEKDNFKVVMTREEDKGLYSERGKIRDKKNEDLRNRCKLKASSNCNMFISIHLNMFPESKYYGAQVWYSKEGKSKELAHIIQQNLIKDLDNNNKRQEKCAKGAYKVLRCNDTMPAVIVECGFLSNPGEEQKLKTDEYQIKIAKSLSNSVQKFFSNKK